MPRVPVGRAFYDLAEENVERRRVEQRIWNDRWEQRGSPPRPWKREPPDPGSEPEDDSGRLRGAIYNEFWTRNVRGAVRTTRRQCSSHGRGTRGRERRTRESVRARRQVRSTALFYQAGYSVALIRIGIP